MKQGNKNILHITLPPKYGSCMLYKSTSKHSKVLFNLFWINNISISNDLNKIEPIAFFKGKLTSYLLSKYLVLG